MRRRGGIMAIDNEDLEQLKYAKALLEHPGFAVRLQNALGKSIESGMRLLPDRFSATIHDATQAALRKALDVAIMTLDDREIGAESRDKLNKTLVTVSGGIGGVFGLFGMTLELPVSTAIMLRSIAEIAHAEGESLKSAETKINCIEVLALGGRPHEDSNAESGYYLVRALMAREVSEAVRYVAERGIAEEGAPAIVRFLTAVAARFGVVITEKAAATIVPIIGGASGAIINNLFIDHFQSMAHGHFTIRRLERKYGAEEVEETYKSLNLD